MSENTPPTATTVRARVSALRAWMQQQRLHAVVVSSADPHLSEYVPEHWMFRAWLSGFDGSAGTVVITTQTAALWTDSRYWLQAESALEDTGIDLMRVGADGVPTMMQWLIDTLVRGDHIGIDGRTLSLSLYRPWLSELEKAGLILETGVDATSAVWSNRPALLQRRVTPHAAPYACRTRQDNFQALRRCMQAYKAQWHCLSSLDDIAWLFNLRGTDIPYNPVFLAYALISQDTAQLFVQPGVVDATLEKTLAADGITLGDYAHFGTALQAIPAEQTLLLDPARTTVETLRHAQHLLCVEALNPTQMLKACKTAQELEHIRQTMVLDGVALCTFFAWLDKHLAQPDATPITELTVDEHLTLARARQPGFVCPSFPTIAAFNANGAMPHYRATPASHAVISGDGLLLIDSGGQYQGGTTDITRMVAIGQPNAAQRQDCTTVLQGMIALSRAVFPRGISAGVLDALARTPIWRRGADYKHGTGHGVGYFLNVHEGPQSISHASANAPHTSMEMGMITSNEPGLYRTGQWGVRIENLLANVAAQQSEEFGVFLAFETLTLCPIDTRCLEISLLDTTERAWLNDYHATVRARLTPHVQGEALDWLMLRTQAV